MEEIEKKKRSRKDYFVDTGAPLLTTKAESLKRASMTDKEARNYFDLEAAFKRSIHQVEVVHVPINFLASGTKHRHMFLLLHLIQRYNKAKSEGFLVALEGKRYKGIWFAVKREELSDYLKIQPEYAQISLKWLKQEHFIQFKATRIQYESWDWVGVIFIQLNFAVMREKLFPDDPDMNDISIDTEMVKVPKGKI
jgi:hypothetical protein